jgi:hypothetical protein
MNNLIPIVLSLLVEVVIMLVSFDRTTVTRSREHVDPTYPCSALVGVFWGGVNRWLFAYVVVLSNVL